MDRATLAAYDQGAAAYAEDWETQPTPEDLHAVVRRFFSPGPTADVGCGSGRDAAWMAANGLDTTGYDASEALLVEARRRHPGVRFAHATLPALAGLGGAGFQNVLCETVIMHLPPAQVTLSVQRMLDLLKPGGTLYLSWRVTEGADKRDDHGRLYAAFDPNLVLAPLTGCEMLLDEQTQSLSSGKIIRRLVARKAA